LKEAQAQLAALEQLWPQYLVDSSKEEELRNTSMEVMRLAEVARAAAIERSGSAIARSEAAIAKLEAERTRGQENDGSTKEDDPLDTRSRYEIDLAQAMQRAEQGVTRAERLEAREEIIRLEVERSQFEQVRRERDEAFRQLQTSISGVLETRRDPRGLIVNVSDGLFDPERAPLTAEARQRLSLLTSILTKYTGNYQIQIEGQSGSGGVNGSPQRLSENRAEAVRDYLLLAGLPANRIISTKGSPETKQIPANSILPDRTSKCRVEIVISEAEPQAAATAR
jgi:outer membrane protein OmpA-like peptidoglycan-associated protein